MLVFALWTGCGDDEGTKKTEEKKKKEKKKKEDKKREDMGASREKNFFLPYSSNVPPLKTRLKGNNFSKLDFMRPTRQDFVHKFFNKVRFYI